ncbi:MAG: ribosome small subunit-dependent GTPase A [Clostridia bacterium]|nr:ribosome small subunit-dependent GTPase A [Clostridia bacterium]
MTGIIVGCLGGLYSVLSDGKIYSCRARGSFRHEKNTPLVGDRCFFAAEQKRGFVIEKLEERKNALIRPSVSNVDHLIIAFAVRSPTPDALYIDKLASVAVYNKIDPIIAITKSDIDGEAAEKYKEIYEKANMPVFITSSEKNEGIDALRNFISSHSDATFAFAGASGVGKSSLLNAIFPDLVLKTGAISEKIERGKHTTRAVSLFPMSNFIDGATGFIADTPGFSMLDFIAFNFFSLDDLPHTFPEFEKYVGKCRWRDCTHTKEDGCAIKDATECGEIAQSRRESFLKMYDELSKKSSW